MDEIDKIIVDMVKVRPRRQAELCQASSLSVQATLYRLQKLQIKNIIWAERDNPQHSVIYHIAPDLEKEEKENEEVDASPQDMANVTTSINVKLQ